MSASTGDLEGRDDRLDFDLRAFTILRTRLWPYVRRHHVLFFLSTLFVALSTAASLTLPWLLGMTVDTVFQAARKDLVLIFAATFACIDFLYAFFMVAHNHVLTLLGQKVLHELRQDLLSKYQRYPLSEFNRTPTGRLVTRLVNDTANLQDLFTSGLGLALGNASVVIGIVVWLIVLNPRLGLVCVSVFPFMIFSAWFFGGVMRKRFRISRAALSKLNGDLAENILGMWLIQIFNRQSYFKTRFEGISRNYTKKQIHAVRSFAYFQPVITVLSSLSLALLIWYGGMRTVVDPSGSMSLGLLVSFIAYLQALYAPVRDITEKFNLFLSAIASSERIFEFLDRPSETGLGDNAVPIRLKGEVEFRSVSFKYAGAANYALRDVSFKINAGEKLGIVGHTGSGKTTLSSLLLRFFDFNEGGIFIDGNPISLYPKIALRESIACIQQEPFLFSGTVEDNIFLWQPHRREAWRRMPPIARVPFEMGRFSLKQEVYERGANLSAGERQIISFVRALVQEPSMLILDEATAHIDSFTERWIEEVSSLAFKDRTVLIIAHRLATLKKVDRLLVMEHGKLLEIGTHSELIGSQGAYYKLCQESLK